MNTREVLTVLVMVLVMTVPFAFLTYIAIIQRRGKHLRDESLGHGATLMHYAVDRPTRRRALIGALVFFVLAAPLCYCFWSYAITKMGFPVP